MRYIKLYLHFIRFSFSKAMEFRVDFFFRFVMDIVFYIISFTFFKIIYLHTPVLGGWSIEQMYVFVGSFVFTDALFMTIFATNAWWFPISVNRGDLDYYLTKPASTFFFLSFKEFAANSMLNLILALGILGFCLSSYEGSFTLLQFLIYLVLLINGVCLYYALQLLFLIPVFWTHSPSGFINVFYSAEKVYQRPDGIFKGFIKRFFTMILPFSLVASYPTKFLFSDSDFSIVAEIFFGSAIIYIFIFMFWKLALKSYSSASS